MYYEERVIDGILCCRTTPGGEWSQIGRIELTARLMRFRDALDKIANYDLEHADPLADCALRQMATSALCKN